MWPFKPRPSPEVAALTAKINQLEVSAQLSEGMRGQLAAVLSGTNFTGDTLHDIAADFGYPSVLTFRHMWNMYRRFGLAKNVVELPVETTWLTPPELEGVKPAELKELAERLDFWQRLKGLDTRQRVGRYAGLFIRVRDGKHPREPIEGKVAGLGAVVGLVPMYEGQLKVLQTVDDPMADDYGMPAMYQFDGSAPGSRNEKQAQSFEVHPSRVIIAAEGADNGSIYGVPALESCYNSLMDLRKIIGGGAEGFYKASAQSLVFSLKDVEKVGAIKEQLDEFNDKANDFMRNRHRRAMWAPGMDVDVLAPSMSDPKGPFECALNDVGAASKIPATILIGQQTGRLASQEDSRNFLSTINARRETYATELVRDVVTRLRQIGALSAGSLEVVWDDLLAVSDSEKLGNAEKLAGINEKQFRSGGEVPFSGGDIREAAGYEPEELPDPTDDEGEALDDGPQD